MNSLPPGFELRQAVWSDLTAVTDLIYAVCEADGDATMAVTSEELAQEWKTPGFTLETDAWVVTDPAGKVVGVEELFNRYGHANLQGDGYVHPDYLNLGIGSSLLAALDARCRLEVPLAASDMRVYLRNGMGINEKNARVIHEEAGFQPIRFYWRMEINLEAEPSPTNWPQNVEIRPFERAAQDFTLYQAHEEAFSDHWGHTPRSYDFWQNNVSGHPDFDPALYFVVWDGEQIAGYSLCRSKQGSGWVGTLGVRRAWRKRGLGQALLQHSFRELYKRGYKSVGLTVDASNPTGATRLYERVGMQIASEYVSYEKEFRPGRMPEDD